MHTKGDACTTCCRNCFSMHRKRHEIYSFFKIMFAEKFDRLLVLPPIFSKKLKSLEGKKMTLEDTNRRTWDVLLFDVEGTLAFQKGWRNFALDHNIERGDLLVFCYVGDLRFLVEIYGRSGCQKKVPYDGMDNNRTEATFSVPKKRRASQSSHEQSAPKRYNTSHAFPGPSINVTPRPKNVHVVKEPSVMTRNVASRGHIHESRPTVEKGWPKQPTAFRFPEPMVESSFPEPVMESSVHETVMESSFRTNRDKNMPNRISVAEIHVESCSMVNGEKKRPKMVPVPETLVDPCTITNRDKRLVEPCFMTTRDENFTVEDDRKCLFDLSVFEMPGKLSTIDKEAETNYLLDFPVYDLPENEAGANRSGGPLLLGSGTSENLTVTEIADKKTTINRDSVTDYILNKSIFEMPENEAGSNRSGGPLPVGSGTSENMVTEIADTKTTINRDSVKDCILNNSTFEMPENEYTNASTKCQLQEDTLCQEPDHHQNAETEAALFNFPSCRITKRKTEIEGSDAIMPLNFILPKTTELSALTGQNLMLKPNNRETRSYKQKVCRHAKGQSFLGASSSVNDQDYGVLEGKNMRSIKQESSKELKQDRCGHATKKTVEIEENAKKIVKLEPAKCDASATAVKVICSATQDYLELPDPLPMAVVTTKSKTKFSQQLVFLQDPRKRLWPVLYHNPYGLQVLASGWKSFTKANYIQPGDQCSFILDDSLEDTCTVQIDYLSQD